MFHHLWNAAKKRPTRALGIAAMALIIGGIAHFLITDWAFRRAIGEIDSLESQYAAIGVFQRSLPAVKLAFVGETASVASGLILGMWAAWRKFRGRP